MVESDDDLETRLTKDEDEDEKKEEFEDKKDQESLEKELANARVELKAKDSAYIQAILELKNREKITDELTILLKRIDSQKNYYLDECREANARADELQSSMDCMARHLSESQKNQEQLTCALAELENSREELAILRMAKIDFTSQIEEMKNALSAENAKRDELRRQVLDMEELIVQLRSKAVENERRVANLLSEKESELELTSEALSSAKNELKRMHDLEAQMAEKSDYIVSLQRELKEVSELHASAKKAVSEGVYEVKRLREDILVREKEISGQKASIVTLETDMKNIKSELGRAKAEVVGLTREIEDVKFELEKSKERENDAQVEIALLKFEVHKGRSKLAAAEATEARAQTEKSALYNALQQMGLEAEEIKKENRELKEATRMQHGDDEEIRRQECDKVENHESYLEVDRLVEAHEPKIGKEVVTEENSKKELEMAMAKIGELRIRVEQAASRAEAAEKAKLALEEKIKKKKVHKERRKAAMAALREDTISREFGTKYEVGGSSSSPRHHYQPLSKVLNMKF
ncbi:uncharacterized protein LOC127241001 [Andrographis paniculata]|uniref:uncharacterized protein LOC127241001 n=1 Tax=Andrographis paniculata TaxID=175694 RepID=UPI0021E7996C|nr:uncharacterized protein LOC127241001 [Andrographis paniculata]